MMKDKRPIAFTFFVFVLTAITILGIETANAETGAKISAPLGAGEQSIRYDKVEMCFGQENGSYDAIISARTNQTAKKIISTERAMLAFDKDGTPLEIDWWAKDNALNNRYLQIHSGLTREIAAGQTDVQTRGWRLNAATDKETAKIAYVLFCDKEITFEDGIVWTNPEYDGWLETYEGVKTDVETLENYYPYIQKIVF